MFWLKIPWSRRKHEMVCCRDSTASSFVAKVWGEFFAHFYSVAIKVTVVCGIDCLACQDEFFVNNPLDVEESDEHALNFALFTCLAFFGLGDVGLIPWKYCCFV
jgi:hypothetical protein